MERFSLWSGCYNCAKIMTAFGDTVLFGRPDWQYLNLCVYLFSAYYREVSLTGRERVWDRLSWRYSTKKWFVFPPLTTSPSAKYVPLSITNFSSILFNRFFSWIISTIVLQMVNLIANDGQRLYEVVTFVPCIIGDPFVVIVGAVHTIWLLGPHAAFGMLVFVLFYPMQYFVSRLTGYFRRRTLSATDQRVCHTNELLQNIKFIEMYAWENPFSNKIKGHSHTFPVFNFSPPNV